MCIRDSAEVVKGAVDAVNKRNDIKIFLVGQKVPVERELSLYTYPKELSLIHI